MCQPGMQSKLMSRIVNACKFVVLPVCYFGFCRRRLDWHLFVCICTHIKTKAFELEPTTACAVQGFIQDFFLGGGRFVCGKVDQLWA